MDHANSNEPWKCLLGKKLPLKCFNLHSTFTAFFATIFLLYSWTGGHCCSAVWSCGSVTVFILERNTETYFDTWVISDNFKLGAATASTVKVLTPGMLTLLNCWQTMLTLTMLNLYLHLPCMLYFGRGGGNTFTGKVCILNLLGLISWHWHLIYNVWLK